MKTESNHRHLKQDLSQSQSRSHCNNKNFAVSKIETTLSRKINCKSFIICSSFLLLVTLFFFFPRFYQNFHLPKLYNHFINQEDKMLSSEHASTATIASKTAPSAGIIANEGEMTLKEAIQKFHLLKTKDKSMEDYENPEQQYDPIASVENMKIIHHENSKQEESQMEEDGWNIIKHLIGNELKGKSVHQLIQWLGHPDLIVPSSMDDLFSSKTHKYYEEKKPKESHHKYAPFPYMMPGPVIPSGSHQDTLTAIENQKREEGEDNEMGFVYC